MSVSSRFQVDDPMALMPRVSAMSGKSQEAPIRLLKFLAYLAIGGSERQALNIRQGLNPARFNIHLGCFGCFDEQIGVDLTGTPLEMFKVRNLYSPATFKECLRLASYLKQQRIDIIHSYNFYANIFALPAARLARVPVVLASIRDTGESLTAWRRAANRMVCRLADRVLVNAEAIKRILIAEGYRRERIIVIPNGIHCPPSDNAPNRTLHQEFGLKPNDVLIAAISRIERLKGLHYFVDAAAEVIARIPQAKFLIIGDNSFDPQYREELKQQTIRLGLQDRVIFTGFRLDVPEIMSSLSVSVLPSVVGEGLSNSLLESMAAGVPVVATNLGGNPEVVVEGKTGLLVPPRNPAALVEAICKILQTPGMRETFGRSGRQRVLDHFSNERMIRNFERLYSELLDEKRRGQTVAGVRPET